VGIEHGTVTRTTVFEFQGSHVGPLDPQMRHLLDNPFGFWVEPRLAPPGGWILDEPLAVPDHSADIELVIENAGAALRPSKASSA
jgi:hypothetical protein